ncbi:MAG: hypothetical protein HY049_11855 [Acidobacteria bacterium]|nr:hypothetical protein [Acidobacteriota bacterium]
MSDIEIDLEELRRRFASLSVNAVPGNSCPPAEAIWEALRGEARPAEIESVVAHTAGCSACAEAWRLGHEFAGAASAAARKPLPRRPRPWTALALAAALVVVAGLAIERALRAPEAIVTRAGEESGIRSFIPETAVLHRQSCRLRWSQAGPGARYLVRVGAEDLTTIATSASLDEPEYIVPEKSLGKLAPGATVVWRVEASLPDGRKLASPAFKNRVE